MYLQDVETPCEDQLVETTVTDSEGNYSFDNLEAGDYTVCEVQQEGWVQTAPTTDNGCYEFSVTASGQTFSANFGNKAKPGKVLGELVDTGTSLTQAYIVGLGLLGSVSIVGFLSRRKRYEV